MIPMCIFVLLFSFEASASSGRVRKIAVQADQIVTVKTALGIATIIQVPDRPNSLVVGDTESFKVEYLDQAITIKPLHAGARSNLYIYTDYKRFNVQLMTGSEAQADYVVYLEHPKVKEDQPRSRLKWMHFSNSLRNESLSLEITRLGRTGDGVFLIEFRLRSKDKTEIDPKWLWLTQGGASKPIHRLAFSSLRVSEKQPVEGLIQILSKDVNSNEHLRLELRRKKTSFLTVPEVRKWK